MHITHGSTLTKVRAYRILRVFVYLSVNRYLNNYPRLNMHWQSTISVIPCQIIS